MTMSTDMVLKGGHIALHAEQRAKRHQHPYFNQAPQRFIRPTGLNSPSSLFYLFHDIAQALIVKHFFSFFRVIAESSCELIKKADCIRRSELTAQ